MTHYPNTTPPYQVKKERSVSLPHGNRLLIHGSGHKLELFNEEESVQLTIRITAEGPVLDLRTSQLNIQTDESLSIRGKQVSIEATESLIIASEGEMQQRIEGHLHTQVRKSHTESAHSRKIQSQRGDVHLEANDFIRLDGEMIKLNCDE